VGAENTFPDDLFSYEADALREIIDKVGVTAKARVFADPRSDRASALDRNILRYRAIEVTLYLFYAEEVRDFMLTDVHRAVTHSDIAVAALAACTVGTPRATITVT
jgi:hypothetical protein